MTGLRIDDEADRSLPEEVASDLATMLVLERVRSEAGLTCRGINFAAMATAGRNAAIKTENPIRLNKTQFRMVLGV